MMHTRSDSLFSAAQQVIPGGVNSPVRAFSGVGGTPRFFHHGEGALLFDEDGNRYIDYVGSWGPLILGHCDQEVLTAVEQTLRRGMSFGAPAELEIRLAEKIVEMVPSVEQVRMVNSGTEATMSAIRLARAASGRNLVVKFEGCYHGHVDSLLVKAGSGALTLGHPSSPGVPEAVTQDTLVLPYNDLAAVQQAFAEQGEKIACVIVEPVAGNMNCVPPLAGFLQGLRDCCDDAGALLIFDEVMTGFRVAAGGAQSLYGITPDLTTLGKVIGGGMPVGAFGGRRELMQQLAPVGPVYQAGTLSGNPLAMAAGLATLNKVVADGFHQRLGAAAERLTQGLEAAAREAGVPLSCNQVGGMFGVFFTEEERVSRFEQVMACDIERFKRFYHGMLEAGVYLAPAAFEAGFVSSCHTDELIDDTLEAARNVFATL